VTGVLVALVLAAGPGDRVLPGVRMAVEVSEELEPDRLRALARPEVVLWVRTRSNGLRRSTAESLATAGAAFVQVRPPLGAPALAPFEGRVGPWVEEAGLDVQRARRWSPGRLAVDVAGPFTEELAARLRVLRPMVVRWSRGGWPEPAEWARARAFAGVELSDLGGAPVDCAAVRPGTRVRVRVALSALTAEGVCGLPLRIEVPAEVEPSAVHAALLGHPEADLSVTVGADAGQAQAARRLLEALVATTPAGGAGRAVADGGSP
jgi:hypothetical protein